MGEHVLDSEVMKVLYDTKGYSDMEILCDELIDSVEELEELENIAFQEKRYNDGYMLRFLIDSADAKIVQLQNNAMMIPEADVILFSDGDFDSQELIPIDYTADRFYMMEDSYV